MKITHLAIPALAVLMASGCVTTRKAGDYSHTGGPSLDRATYKITGQVEGKGQASALCPMSGDLAGSLAGIMNPEAAKGPKGTIAKAMDEAYGNAIWDDQNVDLILNAKYQVVHTDFIVFDKADVTIRGKGVTLLGPSAK